MQDAYHLDVHIPKLPRIPSPLMCYFTLGACDCLKASAPLFLSFPTWLGGVGGREGWGRGFAPRSVFSKCLWSNQVPRRRRRRCRRTELIAGKVFLTFASNHSSLLISIIYFSLPLHILTLTNLFHQLFSFFFSSLPSCLPLPACLMSNSLQDGATASSHAGFPRNARKKKLPRYQGTFICPWMTLGCVTQGGVCSSQCVAHTLRYRPKNKKRRECFIKYLFKCKRRIRILFRWLFMGLSR